MKGKGKIQNNDIGEKKKESGTEYKVNDTNECYTCKLMRGRNENKLKVRISNSLVCDGNSLHYVAPFVNYSEAKGGTHCSGSDIGTTANGERKKERRGRGGGRGYREIVLKEEGGG